jgi:UDP-3-O-[3-hydroxymyristoyl] glucosamine N-acyltransferase
MTEPVFFKQGLGLTIGEIAALTGAVPLGPAAPDFRIFNVAPLDRAGPNDLTFIDKFKYQDALKATHAGACLTIERFEKLVPAGVIRLQSATPYRAFVAVASALFPQAARPSSLFETQGVSKNALVHPSARLEADVTIDPGAVIGPRAEIGSGTLIGPTAVIGPDVRIGRDCLIGAGAAITHALIGDRVIVHPGCRIGQDGFGFLSGAMGHDKIPQIARVIVQDDVEIGANSTIDRGGIRDTVIGEGTKIDNLVQIGHNVMVGRHCIFAGQVGIAGSVTIGDRAMFGGQAGVIDNVTIGEGALITGCAVVATDVPPGARWAGFPAQPMKEWLRSEYTKRNLGRRVPLTPDKEADK